MLHLNGFDDRTRRGFRIMHEMEDKILRELGVGAVFATMKPNQKTDAGGRS
jgi:ssRNA-specific RNase YbeY (16S rRNA maturation enzyme)